MRIRTTKLLQWYGLSFAFIYLSSAVNTVDGLPGTTIRKPLQQQEGTSADSSLFSFFFGDGDRHVRSPPRWRGTSLGSEFLGKRSQIPADYERLERRAPGSEFLGKRAPGSEFLGKRVPGSEFLGKRAPGSEFLGKRIPGSEFLGKRVPGSEFLGKRAPGSEFLGKRIPGSEFLGKRVPGSEFLGKRVPGSEFLGKRAPGSEFLGKRSDDDDEEENLYELKRSPEIAVNPAQSDRDLYLGRLLAWKDHMDNRR